MDQTKIQDIVRHITKDEDYGVGMMENLTLSDAVEVMTQMLPTLKKKELRNREIPTILRILTE